MMPPAYEAFRSELASALDPKTHTIGWLDCQVANGAIRVLGNDKAVILYEFKQFPTGWCELHGMLAAGDLATVVSELIPAAETIAQNTGCGAAEIASRPGWAKLLKDYEVHQVSIKKVF